MAPSAYALVRFLNDDKLKTQILIEPPATQAGLGKHFLTLTYAEMQSYLKVVRALPVTSYQKHASSRWSSALLYSEWHILHVDGLGQISITATVSSHIQGQPTSAAVPHCHGMHRHLGSELLVHGLVSLLSSKSILDSSRNSISDVLRIWRYNFRCLLCYLCQRFGYQHGP